ncbi:hypothetical protein FB107DRAFT_252665 [Schizophyllum commune]
MFATIIVVLPSPFTGGAAHLSHGSLSEVYDCAPASDMKTTTTNPDAPRKIIYLLDHKYSQTNMKGSALKGLDTHKLAILQLLAKQHNFRLGLASLKTSLSGYADDNGCSYGRSRYGRYGYYDDSEEDDDEDVDFAEVEETETNITNLVNLEGRMLQDELEFDVEGDGRIPGDLTEAVQQGEHDGQDYEGYMGNGTGSLSRWYRRTVLVIWPKKFSLGLTFKDDIEDAINTLVNISEKPHKRERKLVNFLLGFAKARGGDNSDIAQNLTHVAFMWSDRGLWVQAMEACGITGVETLSIDDVINVLEEFGMKTVQPVCIQFIACVERNLLIEFCSLEKMMLAEKLNAHRFQFLNVLETACLRLEGPAEGQLVNWLVFQRMWALEHLQPPRVEDNQELLNIAFVPQLKGMPIPDFLASFTTLLHSQKITPDTLEEEKTVLKQIVTDLLAAAILKVNFFAATKTVVPPPRPSYMYGLPTAAPAKVADPQTAATYIDYCLATENKALVETIVERLIDRTGLQPVESQSHAKTVLLPLLPLVGAKMKARPADVPAVPGVRRLFDTTIQHYLSVYRRLVLRRKISRHSFRLASLKGKHVCLSIPFGRRWGLHLIKRPPYSLCSRKFTRSELKSRCRMLKSDYIVHVLVPFIPELRQFLISNGTATHAEPFGAVFTTISDFGENGLRSDGEVREGCPPRAARKSQCATSTKISTGKLQVFKASDLRRFPTSSRVSGGSAACAGGSGSNVASACAAAAVDTVAAIVPATAPLYEGKGVAGWYEAAWRARPRRQCLPQHTESIHKRRARALRFLRTRR